MGVSGGIAVVTVDGRAFDLDLYSATPNQFQEIGYASDQDIVHDSGVMTDTVHTVRVARSGRKNVSSAGFIAEVDAADRRTRCVRARQ